MHGWASWVVVVNKGVPPIVLYPAIGRQPMMAASMEHVMTVTDADKQKPGRRKGKTPPETSLFSVPRNQLVMLSEQTPLNTAVTIGVTLLVILFFSLAHPIPEMYLWGAVNILLPTYVLWRWMKDRKKYRHADLSDSRPTRRGFLMAMLWGALSGGMWGALTYFLPLVPDYLQIPLILTMGGMAAGGATTLAAVPQVALAFVLTSLLPLTLYYMFGGPEVVSTWLPAAFILYTVGISITTLITHRSLTDQLKSIEKLGQFEFVQFQKTLATIANSARSLEDALQEIVSLMCRHYNWQIGHYLLVDTHESGRLINSDYWYLEDQERYKGIVKSTQALNLASDDSLPREVLRRGEPVWVENFAESGFSGPRREEIIKSGINHIAGIPVQAGDKAVAIMEFGSEVSFFNRTSVRELAEFIGIQLGRLAERALVEENEIFLNTVLENIGDQIIACDARGRLRYTLQGQKKGPSHPEDWPRLFGARDSNGDNIMAPEDFPLYRAWKGELITAEEIAIVMEDGNIRRMVVNGRPMQNRDGELLGAVVSMRDVSDIRNMERRLRQAEKLEAIGRLTSGIAHDFNNLLTVVMGNLELIKKSEHLEETEQRRVKTAMSAAETGAELIDLLLTFSRRERAEHAFLSLEKTLRDNHDLLKSTVDNKCKLRLELEKNLWPVDMDEAQFKAALLNVVKNARDANPKGGRIRIAAENVTLDEPQDFLSGTCDPGDYVRLDVRDEGTGISAENLDKILEPFFTTKDVGQGSGLGLSMVYGYVNSARGALDVRNNKDGAGTTVSIILPRSRQSARKNAPAKQKPVGSQAKQSILVVEDNRSVLQMIEIVLQEAGFQVRSVPTGDDALEKLSDGPLPDLVISDITMPGSTDGLGLARTISKTDGGPKIILISGRRLPPDKENNIVKTMGYNAFFYKPFKPEALLQKVNSLLREK